MSTELPATPAMPKEVRTWWASLDDQERIIAALETDHCDDPTYVAEKPWKWAQEAYALRPQGECYVCTHLREPHEDVYVTKGCSVDDCDCSSFEPFPQSQKTGKAT